MNLAEFPMVVTVWHQPGCGHCEEFLPRVQATAARFAHCGVPTVLLDATQNVRLADGLNITATPTLMVLRRGKRVQRFDRGLEEGELESVYQTLARSCRPESPPELEAESATVVSTAPAAQAPAETVPTDPIAASSA
jgi:thioredoxin-like negative regulator of GroEL